MLARGKHGDVGCVAVQRAYRAMRISAVRMIVARARNASSGSMLIWVIPSRQKA